MVDPMVLDGRRSLPTRSLEQAQLLAGAVRDRDPEWVERILRPIDRDGLVALSVTLAAMVPTDQSPTQLLAWNDNDAATVHHSPRMLQPHGTHSMYNRHRKNGEHACEACIVGERDYQLGRARSRRHLAAVEATA